MLDSTPYGFALELAVAASWRELLDLQQWLTDRVRQLALPFFQVKFLCTALLRCHRVPLVDIIESSCILVESSMWATHQKAKLAGLAWMGRPLL